MYFCPGVPGLHRAIVDIEEEVVDLAAGAYHFVCCTSSGAVYSFGCDNMYGQLGDGTVWQRGPLSPPRRVPGFGLPRAPVKGKAAAATVRMGPVRSPACIVAVACGESHTLLLPREGNRLYACGRGDSGQLGDGRTPLQPSCRSVRLLFGLPIASVAAAGDHSLVLLRTGRLLAF
ncbi:hypothetical protein STCU_03386 [Strigomonas culicis]|uniref:Regulator of chromosome condensation n=1 Tax=Strigomonas culicis TaxID=28005 RepID=S9VWY7_9TRYP|nr:hypothetical protein STCU_03386 [Strigomonas culicis]|eukprot:EPY31576.1 hypothetical protein STCU_03386 [Strigomonas culicis]